MGLIDDGALAATIKRLGEFDPQASVIDLLEQVNDGVVDIFEIDGAGLLFLDDEAVPRYVVASGGTSRILETTQEHLGAGPCVESLINDAVVTVDDFEVDGRWPELAAVVVPEGIRSMAGIPIKVGGGAVGSLNVYRSRPSTWSPSEHAALTSFNTLIESVLAMAIMADRHETLVGQLQQALDSRVVIERAVGLLMGRHDLDAVAAFRLLRSKARSQQRKIHEVAAELLDEAAAPPAP